MSLKLMPPIDDNQLVKPKIYRERNSSYNKYWNAYYNKLQKKSN